MRFQVPQFVDIEDRIIGPLTLKQFGVYAIGGMVMVIVYPVVNVAGLVAVAIPVLGLVVLFAHVRIAGQSFAATVIHGVRFFTGPRLYLWRRGGSRRLPASGPEYLALEGQAERGPSALALIAQALTTEGGVVTEDKDDPIAPASEAGAGQSELRRQQEARRRASVAEVTKGEGGT
ncbi:MAG: hypothetical protein COT71_00865 [Candidatus Andersenbacteria bacterium CG10_big_fil_rev_8_21_14_0_10_54_11]|uniref:PrgI family protein n=1 Tax=Candidatus Andersenbacteria bacterium CG10_big_fil_rev_8_21_14_0_10_54_11 TaxID=1974485 RepID=A0A2M6X090_9BACT|nr:MAG: hypothetical protein COT71_00865 [Candidatus Andersenbacteria bacterium CG10_big_fil_rev_8_21_14_0_10_54_11]